MEKINNESLKEDYIGQKASELLDIDYDENQCLTKEFLLRKVVKER